MVSPLFCDSFCNPHRPETYLKCFENFLKCPSTKNPLRPVKYLQISCATVVGFMTPLFKTIQLLNILSQRNIRKVKPKCSRFMCVLLKMGWMAEF